MGGAINSLSASPDWTHIAVAGREVLKIVKVHLNEDSSDEQLPVGCPQRLEVVQNFRTGKTNLNFSSNDVVWHPMPAFAKWMATAATNGAVVIWNTFHSTSVAKQDSVIKDHNRTVNRIAWQPTHGHTLLSGSQDGTMKYWDIRDPVAQVLTFDGHADAVRDVQFSPFYSNYFAAAFDSGTIQVWDIRRTSHFERKITAHRGPCLAIDWHPSDRNWLASGGRDLALRVWDLNEPSHAVRSLGSPSSVARLRWRPGAGRQRPHIAVGAAVMDPSVQLWNLSSPQLPHRTLYGHSDVVTGLLWHRGKDSLLWTCSKDSTLRCHDVRRSYRPIEHVPTTAISWSACSSQLAAVTDRVDRRPPALRFAPDTAGVPLTPDGGVDYARLPLDTGGTPPAGPNNTPVPPDNTARAVILQPHEPAAFGSGQLASQGKRSPAPAGSLRSTNGAGVVHVLSPSGHPRYQCEGAALSSELFCHLARHYRFGPAQRRAAPSDHAQDSDGLARTASVAQLCEHNARVAGTAGQHTMAKLWRLVCTLVQCEELHQQVTGTLVRVASATAAPQPSPRSAVPSPGVGDAAPSNASSRNSSTASARRSRSSTATGRSSTAPAQQPPPGPVPRFDSTTNDSSSAAETDGEEDDFGDEHDDSDSDSDNEDDEALHEALDRLLVPDALGVAPENLKQIRALTPPPLLAIDDFRTVLRQKFADTDFGTNVHAPRRQHALPRGASPALMSVSGDDVDDEDEESDHSDEDDGAHAMLLGEHDAAFADSADIVRFEFADALTLGWGAHHAAAAATASAGLVPAVDQPASATGLGAGYLQRRRARLGGAGALIADDIDVGVGVPDEASGPARSLAPTLFAAAKESDAAANGASSASSSDSAGGAVRRASGARRLIQRPAAASSGNSGPASAAPTPAPSACVPLRPARAPVLSGAVALRSALLWHVEHGDVQTAAAVMLVVRQPALCGVTARTKLRWLMAYVELLQRHRLWSQAIEVAQHSEVAALGEMNKEMTDVPTACSGCNGGLYNEAHRCAKCKSNTSVCSFCHRVVRGLFVWCQGCGHGGHAQHMREWFRDDRKHCPAGCGHVCEGMK